ncbi:Nif3-like dinuclear metal center hexameric protein [Boudabousia tangfeifanii]|uniref:GTP cyclohydrolase 1 type 2 homolog n=1 Tax=Boudabousia tangfeifanii TaxID=1912795 RepID=A0A1D9MKT0_9ACTO|nr:Nif3-like dinuclear metal center hexameric protein [Boudabousia tangfeifanii]AOZ72760.1 Nif3-like dinuclear metal center hexameric protein [Boudabousia tangfeifanii]
MTNKNFPKLSQVLEILEDLYPKSLAQDWDKVGLIVGDLDQEVKCIQLALEPVRATVDEAIANQADLLLVHHPLYLRPTSFLPAADPKGGLVVDLIKHDCALFNAHTNADAAEQGVNTALAQLLGVRRVDVLEKVDHPQHPGMGVVGKLSSPMTLAAFAHQVATALPASPHGILVGGDLEDQVETVAICSGAGDSLLETARKCGADVYVTADLRHHPASEHLAGGKPYLINASHWATETVWQNLAKPALLAAFAARGMTCEVKVSTLVTEPWNLSLPTTESEQK